MKIRKRNIRLMAMLLVVCTMISWIILSESYQAAGNATSYTDPSEFYHSTGQGDGKHIDVDGGKVYFATQAKIASSSSNLRYTTLGFDVTLSGGGASVSFAVKRGGSLAVVDSESVGKYEYILYCISEKSLFELAKTKDAANAEKVLSASKITVYMDAIMTTKQNGVEKGSITENGAGGLYEKEPVYHLKNKWELNDLKSIFSGHTFESYKDVEKELDNNQLTIYYSAGEGSVGGNYYKSTFSSGGKTVYNAIYQSGAAVKDQYKLLQKFYLKSASDFGLSRTGYHLGDGYGHNEWITEKGVPFTMTKQYQSIDIEPGVAYDNKRIFLYANWQPNAYTINYNGNGADGGTISPQSMVYDKTATLRNNLFYRTGYTFNGWNTKANETGTAYSDQQTVSNLVTSGTITLYAQWKPCVYKITTDKQTGTGGTDTFYEKFNTGFYSNSACTSKISTITIPSRIGYDFMGYYSWINKSGQTYVNNIGKIVAPSTQFTENTTVYAGWEAKKFPITFDKQGGVYGSDKVIATYDLEFPQADAPVREGYSFKGYYTEMNGNGTQYYNEFMSSGHIFKYVNAITLYAHWVDDVPPEINLESTHEKWTNDTIGLTASATDFGSGLESLSIYIIEADGSLTCVAEETNLNGVKVKELTFSNNTEGVIRYKAVATDVMGNVAESYNTVYYDIEAPNGDVTATINGTTFYFEVDITDINTGD